MSPPLHHLYPETPLSVRVLSPFLEGAAPSLSSLTLYFSFHEHHVHGSEWSWRVSESCGKAGWVEVEDRPGRLLSVEFPFGVPSAGWPPGVHLLLTGLGCDLCQLANLTDVTLTVPSLNRLTYGMEAVFSVHLTGIVSWPL